MPHRPENLLTVWADALLGALADAGVRDVIASPGSRSTPFLLAALAEPRLTVTSILDERAAAFYALGLARTRPHPPLLLCTSGSAPAHYYPAVIEASEATLPLVVLSADRPRELALAGAPQTTDQQRLFTVHARAFADLGDPHPGSAALRGMRRTVARLVSLALGPEPGPVQINAPARKPLERVEATSPEGEALAERARSLPPVSAAPASIALDGATLDELAAAIDAAERPLIVAGPSRDAAPSALALAARAGAPIFAEAASQLRFADRGDAPGADRLAHWIGGDPGPDLVLELGGTPTSGEYARWLAASGPARRYVVGGARFRDPSGDATRVVLGDTEAILAGLTARVRPAAREAWRSTVAARERRADDALERALEREAWCEIHAARAVVDALPAGARLAVGNSLPIRSVDRFVHDRAARLRVLSARGVNGIDGWIAGAAGAATDGVPTVALIGDVTAAHDVGSLQLAADARSPLVIVALDNGGGRIFEELPIASAASPETMRRFTTPPRLDLAAVARAFGLAADAVEDEPSLRAALDGALARPGATLIHVRVPDHGAARVLARVREAMA